MAISIKLDSATGVPTPPSSYVSFGADVSTELPILKTSAGTVVPSVSETPVSEVSLINTTTPFIGGSVNKGRLYARERDLHFRSNLGSEARITQSGVLAGGIRSVFANPAYTSSGYYTLSANTLANEVTLVPNVTLLPNTIYTIGLTLEEKTPGGLYQLITLYFIMVTPGTLPIPPYSVVPYFAGQAFGNYLPSPGFLSNVQDISIAADNSIILITDNLLLDDIHGKTQTIVEAGRPAV